MTVAIRDCDGLLALAPGRGWTAGMVRGNGH
jgi:hypothetical protein